MAYVYATPVQLEALKKLQEELIVADKNLATRKTAEYTTRSFLQALSGLPFPGAWDVQNGFKWPDTELNGLFYKKYPTYAGKPEWITRKMIVSMAAPNTDTNYNEVHNAYFSMQPFGGTEFLNVIKKLETELRIKYDDAQKEAKQKVLTYEKFLEDQDKKKDDVISTAGITAAVTNFNRAIDDITSDPKKIALYIAGVLVMILIIYIIIKSFTKNVIK